MVVQRELRVTARRPQSYWMRVLAGGFASLALLQNTGRISNGRGLFFTAVSLALMVCLFEGARRASMAIARERREGTLGLLFLTRLSGAEVVRGKFAAIAISTFQTGLAAVPVLAVSLLFGGVSAGEFVRAIAALAHALTLVIVLGLAASANAKDEDNTMMAPVVFVVISAVFMIAMAFGMPALRAINPATPIVAISDAQYARWPPGFWISIALWQGFAWAQLRLQGKALAQSMQFLPPSAFSLAPEVAADYPVLPEQLSNYAPRPRWFSANPMEWFTLRDMGISDGKTRTLLHISMFIAAPAILVPEPGIVLTFLGIVILIIWLCVMASRPIARLFENGILELLITTPLGEQGVLDGHVRALRKMFFWPLAICLGAVVIGFLRVMYNEEALVYFCLYAAAVISFTALATPWIGILAALKTKSWHRAVGWTLFFALALPRLLFFYFGDLIYLAIGTPFVRDFVKKNFRRLVTERYSS